MAPRSATLVLCIGFVVCQAATPPAAATRPATKGPQAVQQLDRAWRRIEKPTPSMGVRRLFDFALEAAAAGYRPDRIARALALAEQMQDRDETSRTYGNFRWYWRADRPEDRNAVEFCMQKGILVWMFYKDALNDEGRQRLQRLIRFSVEGIRRHGVREAYTNIFLMKTWNCIAIGENTSRPQLAEEGRAMLDRWLIYTWENGIHEYLSPTYYGVDLDSLGLIARHATDATARRNAEAALRLFWADIAANFFAPAERLGGAHSRDYDYLTGHGYLDHHLRMLGWIAADRPYVPGVFFQLCKWAPPAEIRRAAGEVPRIVHQRWGGGPGQTASHYVGRSFSIGSAGANYGPMDKVLTVNLAGGPGMVVASFLMDARGDPYGKKRFLTGGGHSKALHVPPFVASVQRGSEVLLLAAADPSDRRFRRFVPKPTCLLSHVVIPADVDVWIGETPAKFAQGRQRLDVPPDAPVFLRFRDVAVAVRFVLALDVSGKPAPVAVVADGARYGAMRITCTHAAGPPDGRGVVALWVAAAEGLDEEGFARFRSRALVKQVKRRDDRVTVAAGAGRKPLALTVDLATGRTVARSGADKGAADALLAVNGREIGREILATADVIARYRKVLADAAGGAEAAARAGQVIEAETAALIVPPFRIDADERASGGKFVWMPGEVGGRSASAVARAAWAVHVPKAGTYTLWARVQAPTPSDDSFFVRIRQAGRDVQPRAAWHTGTHKQWRWTAVTVGETRRPLAVALKPGAAVIELHCREDGTRVDAICLTADAKWRPPRRE